MIDLFLRRLLPTAVCCALLAGCAGTQSPTSTDRNAEDATGMQLVKGDYAGLPGWQQDRVQGALDALQKSCVAIVSRAPDKKMQANGIGGTAQGWQPACRALADLSPAQRADDAGARQFVERWFDPYQITTANGDDGLFTGYYEAALRGSLTPQGRYTVPLYRRPADLVTIELGAFRPTLQGQRLAGRVVNGALQPYADRAAITNGALRDQNLELVWVDSAIDAFFLQVQGSGRVVLPDGQTVRVGYDAQNGHPYSAIGGELVRRGALTKQNVSLQTIRDWLRAHPAEADTVMNTNRSYVFLKTLDGQSASPTGASNVALTAERSLAVDPRFVPYGAPVFLATTDPLDNRPLNRLLIAQDTGGAIRGPVRGDVFWGYGAAAERRAGLMKQRGRAWLLLPKNTDSALSVSLPQ